MSTRVYKPRLVWNEGDLTDAAKEALASTLLAWEGTHYESGQSFIQRGADCTGSVFGVLDTIDGRDRMAAPGFPHDGALHDRKGAIKAMKEIMRRYEPYSKVEADAEGMFQVEPGDTIVTGMPGGGPGHVEIVGTNKNELWHALPASGFHRGGWALLDVQILHAVFRVEDKHRWSL